MTNTEALAVQRPAQEPPANACCCCAKIEVLTQLLRKEQFAKTIASELERRDRLSNATKLGDGE